MRVKTADGACRRVGWRTAVKFRILRFSDLLNTMAVLVLRKKAAKESFEGGGFLLQEHPKKTQAFR
jgi:hypothetical protein